MTARFDDDFTIVDYYREKTEDMLEQTANEIARNPSKSRVMEEARLEMVVLDKGEEDIRKYQAKVLKIWRDIFPFDRREK